MVTLNSENTDNARIGEDHPEFAVGLNNLAQLYRSTNRREEARPLMKRALEILVRRLGKEHPLSAGIQRNLNNLEKELMLPE